MEISKHFKYYCIIEDFMQILKNLLRKVPES